ncbi:hypothetical protein [Luteimonas galliterrae]|nr:hypothetical protein [Luteimonas galliterrae]
MNKVASKLIIRSGRWDDQLEVVKDGDTVKALRYLQTISSGQNG